MADSPLHAAARDVLKLCYVNRLRWDENCAAKQVVMCVGCNAIGDTSDIIEHRPRLGYPCPVARLERETER